MVEEAAYSDQQILSEISTRMRDLEEKQNLVKDRLLLIGQSVVDERDKTFREVQEIKSDVIRLKEENARMKDILQRVTEQLENSARKEELMMLERQFDLFRKK